MATEAGGFDALLSAFDRFYKTLDATTVPAEGGGRTVGGIAHAVALSEATNALYGELGATSLRLFQQHGQSVAEFPPGVTLMESDSPDGPWTPIPAGEVNMATMGIGGNGADAMLLAALESATKVAAFPIDKWNAMQAARPGANHQRFHAGEVVSAADLAVLESAAKLLRMKAPPATPTVSVSPDLLDRLQRAAAAVDPGAIDRAAERAASKAVEAMETRDDPGIGGTDTDWKDVQGRLLAKRDRGEPYTSLRKLCAELHCSDATIRKAIDESETLKGWQARSTGIKAAPKATDLGAVVRDNTRQTTEPAPDDVLPDDDVDATMARLIDQAKPDERAKLNALDDAGRRALVAAFQAHNLDDEPSPLESDKPGERPRKVKQHKRA